MEYQEKRNAIDVYFEKENKLIKTEISPCGKYTIEIFEVETKPGAWKYTRGIVKKDSAVIADIKRNYSSFWFTFHGDYLFCGEDYQAYNIVNLLTGENRVYIDTPAVEKGAGFCWYGCDVSPDGKTLAVSGCYWAAPTDLVFFDISNMEKEPEYLGVYQKHFYGTDGWRGNDYVVYTEIDRRKSDGKLFDDLTSEENEIVFKDWDNLMETERIETLIPESLYSIGKNRKDKRRYKRKYYKRKYKRNCY